MELREYVHIAKKYWVMIVVVTAVLVAGSVLFRSLQPTMYTASRALTLTRVNTQKTTDYKFDDYYAIQSADLFNKTVIAWLQTPSDVLDVYKDAGVSAPTQNLNALSRIFDTTKISPQVVQVQFAASNEADAKKIADSVVKIVQNEVEKQNSLESEQASFHIDASDTVVVVTPKNLGLIAAVALLIGLFVSYNLALLIHYFSKGSKA